MAQVINTNVASLNTQRALNRSQGDLNTALQRLSSGLRVNSAKDDAAGLAIAERFTAQIRGYNQAIRNSNDAISLAQTAEGALQEVTNALQRIREIAVQAVNATNSQADRTSLNEEVKQLRSEITRVGATKFNGISIVGSGATKFKFQVGPNAGDMVSITTTNVLSTATLGFRSVVTSGQVSAGSAATALIGALDTYLNSINSIRATLGAIQNRFEVVIRNGQNVSENLTASRSRIVDADFAEETAKLSRAQVLQQAGIAMLSQANATSQNVLSLLQ